MEAFNQKIKDKINLYEYEDEVSDQKVANFFEKLDTQQSRERKVVQIFKPTDWGSSFILKIAASIAILFTASFGIIRFSDVSIVVVKVVWIKNNKDAIYSNTGMTENRSGNLLTSVHFEKQSKMTNKSKTEAY